MYFFYYSHNQLSISYISIYEKMVKVHLGICDILPKFAKNNH